MLILYYRFEQLVVLLKIGIAIPVYNEEERIAKTLDDLRKSLMRKYRKDLVLLFVCDGSTDNTER